MLFGIWVMGREEMGGVQTRLSTIEWKHNKLRIKLWI